MRTKTAKAPENLERLLALQMNTFTIKDVMRALDISQQRAHAAILHGMKEEKIRLARAQGEPNRPSIDASLYQRSTWSREWITRSWRTTDDDQLAS